MFKLGEDFEYIFGALQESSPSISVLVVQMFFILFYRLEYTNFNPLFRPGRRWRIQVCQCRSLVEITTIFTAGCCGPSTPQRLFGGRIPTVIHEKWQSGVKIVKSNFLAVFHVKLPGCLWLLQPVFQLVISCPGKEGLQNSYEEFFEVRCSSNSVWTKKWKWSYKNSTARILYHDMFEKTTLLKSPTNRFFSWLLSASLVAQVNVLRVVGWCYGIDQSQPVTLKASAGKDERTKRSILKESQRYQDIDKLW